jgi:hypothetical protein
MTWLRQILLASAVVAQTASVNPHGQEQPVLPEEGDLVSESELARELPADKDHPLVRKLIAAEEGEISCEPTPEKILVAHYRAEPTAQFSMRDDRILIAVRRDDGFEILKVLQSETVVVDGSLSSDNDFEEEFITIEERHFLYIRTRVSGSGGIVEHDVYTISSNQKLSIVPFQDTTKAAVLKEGEALRNGGYRFAKGTFTFESGIYKTNPRGNCHNCQLLVKKRVLGDSATELIEFPSQRGLSVNRAVLEKVPSYFESRADAVGATAPIFSATTLAAS